MRRLKLDRRWLRTRRRGVGQMDARHSGPVEHQPLCTLWAGRAPEDVALNSTHRDGVGFDLHQAHPRAARYALHHAPRYQARTWNALAGHAVKRLQRIALGCGCGATNCDEIRALRRRLWRWIRPGRPDRRRLQLPMGFMHGRLSPGHCRCILHRQACKAAQAGWQTVPSWRCPPSQRRCGDPCASSHRRHGVTEEREMSGAP